ncbi:hypothetical protein [Dickeya chrysanthemi]|uniref:hypothetical protein n=1 Tax=Dickeya chrysanthemi TaxID=556 RepID=UPI00067EE976|nr:hypothetical protein [Dickeya chrysanthemi]
MSFLAKLKESQNISDIANLLGCSPKSLAYTIYKSQNNYITFKISKKNGGHRDIKAPAKKLKELQRRLAKGLQECIEEIHGKKIKRYPRMVIQKENQFLRMLMSIKIKILY